MLQELPKCDRETWSKHMLGKWHLATSLQLKKKKKLPQYPWSRVKQSAIKWGMPVGMFLKFWEHI